MTRAARDVGPDTMGAVGNAPPTFIRLERGVPGEELVLYVPKKLGRPPLTEKQKRMARAKRLRLKAAAERRRRARLRDAAQAAVVLEGSRGGVLCPVRKETPPHPIWPEDAAVR